MSKNFDLIAVGTGTAASTVATEMEAAGWSVAVIDFRPFGGTCALRGCDPKKMLRGGASSIDHVQRMQGKGVAGLPHVAWPDLVAFKSSYTDPIPAHRAESFSKKGIETFKGRARFTGPNRLDVDGQELQGRHILLAMGAEPVGLGIPGEEYLIDNEAFMALEQLPRRIVMVGGGYIAAEFSHIAARAGADVTVLQRGERLLTRFEPELVDWLMASFKTAGINVHTRTEAKTIEKTADGFQVTAECAGRPITFDADLVIHAAGRVPALEALDLDSGGVSSSKGRLELNDYLQSVSNPAVYAAGDAAQLGPPLTPVAGRDGRVVAGNLKNGNRLKPDYRGVPSVAFCLPPIAAVGMSEAQARESGLDFAVKTTDAQGWFTARQQAEKVYGFKTLVEKGSGRLLGAHLVGPHADEVINIFALAIRQGLSVADLKDAVFAYPTGASDISSML